MELATLIVSILAILISIGTLFCETKREYKITRMEMENEFYTEIFKTHLIKKIPKARSVMRFDQSNHLKDSEPLIDELNEIRHDSLYYMYNNREFYLKLKEKLQTLEDFLVENQAKTIIADEQTLFLSNVQEKLNDIYNTIAEIRNGKTS